MILDDIVWERLGIALAKFQLDAHHRPMGYFLQLLLDVSLVTLVNPNVIENFRCRSSYPFLTMDDSYGLLVDVD